jgi:hypothetical protein
MTQAWNVLLRAMGERLTRITLSTAFEVMRDYTSRTCQTEMDTRMVKLLRHVFGNPFRPFASPSSWPSTVTALATALYDGEDCHYALSDALMEIGHVELAEHFDEPGHPKGCWAMDLILGKK